MIALSKNYMTAFAAAAVLALTLSACGGGGGDGPVDGGNNGTPMPEDVDLSNVTPGFVTQPGIITLAAGQSLVHGDITFSCAPGGTDCEVVVIVDANGGITATSTGGMVTVGDASEPNSPGDRKLEAAVDMGHSNSWPSLDSTGAPRQGEMFSPGANADYDDIPGWAHEAYERQNPAMGMTAASMDMSVVYRNTDPETPTAFAEVYTLDVDAVADPNNENDSLGNIASLDPMLVDGSMLPLSVADGNTFAGTFDGASGEYTCADAAGCSLTFDGSGNVIAVIGTMHFTPSAGATVLVPDSDFIYFGYWMNESTDGNGDPVFEIAGLYDGTRLSIYTDVQQLLDSATYEGSTTGLYVRRWTDSRNDVLRRRSGQFTADVTLTANFDVDGFVTTNDFSISGTMSNFMDGNWNIDPNWHLALERASFGPDSYGNTEFSGSTQDVDENGDPIVGAAGMGDWNGRFFGSVTVDDRSTGDVDETVRPSGVAGSFDGHFNNGVVIGAFGAERQ